MRLAAFLIGRRPVHPEHAEHYATAKTLRIGAEMTRELVVVVRLSKAMKWRLRLAMALMRIAGKIGGFKSVRLERNK